MAVSSSRVAIQSGWSVNSAIIGSMLQGRNIPLALLLTGAGSNIHRVDYHKVLLDEARRLGATMHLDCDIVKVDIKIPAVTSSLGTVYTGDVVVGADGKPRQILRDNAP